MFFCCRYQIVADRRLCEAAEHVAREYLGIRSFVGAGAKHSALFCWLYVGRSVGQSTMTADDK